MGWNYDQNVRNIYLYPKHSVRIIKQNVLMFVILNIRNFEHYVRNLEQNILNFERNVRDFEQNVRNL